MEKKAEYRNVKRTKKLIREAFNYYFFLKKDISKISVKEIVERADISKSTFYCHYADIYDVALEYENEMLNFLEETMDSFSKSNNPEFMPYIKKIFDIIKENESLYKLFLSTDLSEAFINKLKKLCRERMLSEISRRHLDLTPKTKLVIVDFITNGIVYLFVDYFKSNLNITLDELAQIINQLLLEIYKLDETLILNKK